MMLSKFYSALFLPALLFSNAQASTVNKRSVGALTPLSEKSNICNILDYGGVADNSTDVGPAITKAFSDCVLTNSSSSTLYIPSGTYSIQTGVILNKGSAFAIQLDGLIILSSDGSFDGNAIVIENASDVEVFSSTGEGAINGQGYIERITDSGQNARLMRFITCSDVSVHDLIFVDSPTFNLVFNEVSNLEAYQITIRGPDIGGTDGIDLLCTDNCYVHHIEVTNRDECVCVKTPSQNVLIEEIYCNHSGGMSIGSLTANNVTTDTEAVVSNITMRNIYSFQCTQMLMIKTFPGGSGAIGYVKDSVFENFWGYDSTYGLDIDQYWYDTNTPDTGAVALSGLTFNNWTGTVDNGISRAPIVIRGSDIVPIVDVTLTDFNMWTVNNDVLYHQCENVYGTGYCARSSTTSVLTTFTSTLTVTATPTGYTSPTSPAWGISGYGTTDPIPIYTPAVFWSPASPAGAVATASQAVNGVAQVAAASIESASAVSSSSAATSTASTSSIPATSSLAISSVTKSIISTTSIASSSSTTVATAAISTVASGPKKISGKHGGKGRQGNTFNKGFQ